MAYLLDHTVRRYLRSNFVIDLVGSFPINLIIKAAQASSGEGDAEESSAALRLNRQLRLVRIIKLNRLLRLSKLSKYAAGPITPLLYLVVIPSVTVRYRPLLSVTVRHCPSLSVTVHVAGTSSTSS